jgi:hypothetical protein
MACEVLVVLVLIILLRICMGTNIITDLDWLYYRNSDFIVIFGNTTLKYRCGFGKCMTVMDVNNYRLGMSVVVDCYKVQNVRIKET